MQIDRTNDLNACNYKMFLYTVRNLASSQGFYSILQSEIDSWDEDKHEEVKNYLNNLPQRFNEPVDVILFLEG